MNSQAHPVLESIPIPSSVDQRDVPEDVRKRIIDDRLRIESFQDRWDRRPIEQFVAADYLHLYQSIDWVRETQMMTGQRFLEWGCGFAVVSAIASSLGFVSFGIEAEPELIEHGRQTINQWKVDTELFAGNFLPPGADKLAHTDGLPSLGHAIDDAYEAIGLDIDDFAIIYSYPWPGEHVFHEAVFGRYAARGSLLMMFCGPNDIRLARKVG